MFCSVSGSADDQLAENCAVTPSRAKRGAAAASPPSAQHAAFDVQAHRGGRGLSPENTLAAFRRALSIGVTTLETDLAVTRDGVLVLAHDPHLNPDLVRGPDGRWLAQPGPAIRSLTLAELRRYDIGRVDPSSKYGAQWPQQQAQDGERYPTLDELFALADRIAVMAGGRLTEPLPAARLTPERLGLLMAGERMTGEQMAGEQAA